LIKNPNLIVTRARDEAYTLVNRGNGAVVTLSPQQAAAWDGWSPSGLRDRLDELIKAGLIRCRSDDATSESQPCNLDALRLTLAGVWSKSYAETPDLTILFNTRAMRQNNPFLTLGPYGSLIWRGIQAGWTFGALRRESQRVFDCDEVAPFAQRLMRLGFLAPVSEVLTAEWPRAETIKEFLAPEVQFTLRHARLPWYCLWEVCTTCDLRCRICYLPNFNMGGPAPAEAQAIVAQIVEAGIFYVGLLGGEVLLRQDLEALVAALRSAGVFVKIITNGQRLTVARASALADAGLNQVEVSFDGLSAAAHEASRGRATFARAVDALAHAQARGIPRVGMVLTLHADNVEEFSRLPDFMRRHGVSECYVSLFKKTGQMGSRSIFEPVSASHLQPVRRRIAAWRSTDPDLNVTLLSECSCGRTSVVIGADQRLRLCTFDADHPAGDLREAPLLKLWQAIDRRAWVDGPLGYCQDNLSSDRLP
jgi:MoaA/NifB/PqqE/SkfB family radical SAM enzyme